jgi:hypothetical protein
MIHKAKIIVISVGYNIFMIIFIILRYLYFILIAITRICIIIYIIITIFVNIIILNRIGLCITHTYIYLTRCYFWIQSIISIVYLISNFICYISISINCSSICIYIYRIICIITSIYIIG